MSRSTSLIIIGSVIILIALLVSFAIYYKSQTSTDHFTKPIGVLKVTKNEKLQSNINTFMESQAGDSLGKDNYYCSNLLYGYDDKYAYAWVYCSGFVVKNNNELEQGTAFSIPTRLEYKLPNFQIINFKQPDDGTLYISTIRQLFPKSVYDLFEEHPSNVELSKLEQDVRSRVKGSVPLPRKA